MGAAEAVPSIVHSSFGCIATSLPMCSRAALQIVSVGKQARPTSPDGVAWWKHAAAVAPAHGGSGKRGALPNITWRNDSQSWALSWQKPTCALAMLVHHHSVCSLDATTALGALPSTASADSGGGAAVTAGALTTGSVLLGPCCDWLWHPMNSDNSVTTTTCCFPMTGGYTVFG